MASLSSIRNKLDSKVFAKLGSTAVVASRTDSSQDKWGDAAAEAYASGTTVTVVPFNYMSSDLTYEPFGNLQAGEVAIIGKYSDTFQPRDKVTYDSSDYFVKQIEKFVYDDGVIAQALLLELST